MNHPRSAADSRNNNLYPNYYKPVLSRAIIGLSTAAAEEMPTFEAGDRVEATNCGGAKACLNGRRGTIKQTCIIEGHELYGVLFDGQPEDQGPNVASNIISLLFLRQNINMDDVQPENQPLGVMQLFLYQNEEDSFRQHMERMGPQSLPGLVTNMPMEAFRAALFHRAARNIESWCSDEAIKQFLADDDILLQLIKYTVYQINRIKEGMVDQGNMVDVLENKVFNNNRFCVECGCLREESNRSNAEIVFLEAAATEDNESMAHHVHYVAMVMEVMSALLLRPSSDKLFSQLTNSSFREYGVLESPIQLFATQMHLARSLPTVTEAITEVVARIMVIKPLAVFSMYTNFRAKEDYIQSVRNRLESVVFWTKDLMQNVNVAGGGTGSPSVEISDEIKEGWAHTAKCLIDMLPILYHLGSWRECYSLEEYGLLAKAIIIGLAHFSDLHLVCHLTVDAAPHTGDYSRVRKSIVFADPLLLKEVAVDEIDEGNASSNWRKDLLIEAPGSFAVTGLVEVLGWWVYKGYRLTNGCKSASSMLHRTLPLLECIVKQSPRVSHIVGLAKRLAKKRIPNAPVLSSYLLFDPLFFKNRRCGLAECNKMTSSEGGSLLRCGGGCENLEHYCCREHQVADWKDGHKRFCNANKRKDS